MIAISCQVFAPSIKLGRWLSPRSALFRLIFALLIASAMQFPLHAQTELDLAIQRSVRFLTTEVPGWMAENKCASCHNQGDGARALLATHRSGSIVEPRVLESTFRWLETPDNWEKNRGLPEASDQQLANLQFAATLASAHQVQPERFKTAIEAASKLLIAQQSDDGAWRIEDLSTFASPITQGPILLTGQAARVLRLSQAPISQAALARATAWLERQEPRNTYEISSHILASIWLDDDRNQLALRGLSKLAAAQADGGGWGPHANAPAEIYDTSLAIIALASTRPLTSKIKDVLSRGAEHLLRVQNADGSWNATTRPPGTESYAHCVSTTAWATQALLLVREHQQSP
jgi:hypothetical protein